MTIIAKFCAGVATVSQLRIGEGLQMKVSAVTKLQLDIKAFKAALSACKKRTQTKFIALKKQHKKLQTMLATFKSEKKQGFESEQQKRNNKIDSRNVRKRMTTCVKEAQELCNLKTQDQKNEVVIIKKMWSLRTGDVLSALKNDTVKNKITEGVDKWLGTLRYRERAHDIHGRLIARSSKRGEVACCERGEVVCLSFLKDLLEAPAMKGLFANVDIDGQDVGVEVPETVVEETVPVWMLHRAWDDAWDLVGSTHKSLTEIHKQRVKHFKQLFQELHLDEKTQKLLEQPSKEFFEQKKRDVMREIEELKKFAQSPDDEVEREEMKSIHAMQMARKEMQDLRKYYEQCGIDATHLVPQEAELEKKLAAAFNTHYIGTAIEI